MASGREVMECSLLLYEQSLWCPSDLDASDFRVRSESSRLMLANVKEWERW